MKVSTAQIIMDIKGDNPLEFAEELETLKGFSRDTNKEIHLWIDNGDDIGKAVGRVHNIDERFFWLDVGAGYVQRVPLAGIVKVKVWKWEYDKGTGI